MTIITNLSVHELEAQLAQTEADLKHHKQAVLTTARKAEELRTAIANAQAKAPTTETEDAPKKVNIRFGDYRVIRFISGMWQVTNGRIIVDTHATLSTAILQATALADA